MGAGCVGGAAGVFAAVAECNVEDCEGISVRGEVEGVLVSDELENWSVGDV